MTTSPGTSIHTQARLTGGLPVRFARRSAPAPGEPVPSPASTSTARKTARTRLNVDDARCEALFASALAIGRTGRRKRGRSDQPRRAPVRYPRLRQPDGTGVRRPPQAAAERMRWVRQLAAAAAAPATCEPGPEAAWPVPGARRPPGHDSAGRRGQR